ncbi:MAG: histidine kinase [Actinomycetaceae bacterium]|nr:histidine kinase [Actinomycetaceae bacterium]
MKWVDYFAPLTILTFILTVPSALGTGVSLITALLLAIRLGRSSYVFTTILIVIVLSIPYFFPSLPFYPIDPNINFDPTAQYITTLIYNLIFNWIAVFIGIRIRARANLVSSLQEETEQLKRARIAHAERARAEERARISREMHDSLAHRLSLLSLHAGALATRDDLPPDQVRAIASTVRTLSTEASSELRQILTILHSGGHGDSSLTSWEDVTSAIERERHAGRRIDFHIAYGVLDLFSTSAPLSRHALVRVIEEPLTNARKHAPMSSVTISIAVKHEETTRTSRNKPAKRRSFLHIRITNPLTTRDLIASQNYSEDGSGLGLTGMEERMRLLGGKFSAGPITTDNGMAFRVDAEIPAGGETREKTNNATVSAETSSATNSTNSPSTLTETEVEQKAPTPATHLIERTSSLIPPQSARPIPALRYRALVPQEN